MARGWSQFVMALAVCLAPAIALARSQVGAATTLRIAIGSEPPREYRVYGNVEAPELYAPIAPALRDSGVGVRQQGDLVELRSGDRLVVKWQVMVDVADLRPGAEPAQALAVDSSLYLPVRATARALTWEVRWDEPTGVLTLAPAASPRQPAEPRPPAERRPPTATPPPAESKPAPPTPPNESKPPTETRRPVQIRPRATPAPTPPPAARNSALASAARLASLELVPTEDGFELRLKASAPVRVTSFTLTGPPRIVFDFQPAIWEPGLALPTATGIDRVRIGQFEPVVARLVLDIAELNLRVLSLPKEPVTEPVIRLARGVSATSQRPRLVGRMARALASRDDLLLRRSPELIAPDAPLLGRIVCIDAGHGGHDVGARGWNGLVEHEVNLAIALDLAELLQEAGATVVMPRIDNTFVALEDRVAFAYLHGAEAFVSIHCNAMPRPGLASGAETYFYTPQSLPLAERIHAAVVGATQQIDRGVRRRGFVVVRDAPMPAVLLEVGFIDHPADGARLADPQFRRRVAAAVRDALIGYFGSAAK